MNRKRPTEIDYAFAGSPFGEVLVAATAEGICALFFSDNRAETLAELRMRFPDGVFTERMIPALSNALSVFEDGGAKTANVKLHLNGTPFQMEVWRALMEIPRGRLVTYSDIAKRVGRPRACRAVGSAIGANPVSVIVPCHRVVRSDGTLGNYHWGINRKKSLIESELERAIP